MEEKGIEIFGKGWSSTRLGIERWTGMVDFYEWFSYPCPSCRSYVPFGIGYWMGETRRGMLKSNFGRKLEIGQFENCAIDGMVDFPEFSPLSPPPLSVVIRLLDDRGRKNWREKLKRIFVSNTEQSMDMVDVEFSPFPSVPSLVPLSVMIRLLDDRRRRNQMEMLKCNF